jgi:hypothetical protein
MAEVQGVGPTLNERPHHDAIQSYQLSDNSSGLMTIFLFDFRHITTYLSPYHNTGSELCAIFLVSKPLAGVVGYLTQCILLCQD